MEWRLESEQPVGLIDRGTTADEFDSLMPSNVQMLKPACAICSDFMEMKNFYDNYDNVISSR